MFQVYRGRLHTWSERFFLLACLFAGFYAVSDWFLFNAGDRTVATLAVLASLTNVLLAELFSLLFTLAYVGRISRWHWGFGAVSGLILVLIWLFMLEDVPEPPPGDLWLPLFNPIVFGLFLTYVLAYSMGGILNLYRLYGIVRPRSRRLARKTQGLIVTLILVFVLGLTTNGYLGATRNTDIPPPFSTLLFFVAVVVSYTLYPAGRERISEVVRRFRARHYEIREVFLVYQDSTLVHSKSRSRGSVDQDLFSATLDVIQNFMRTSFPILRGSSLKTIEHGDLRIIIERGRYCYLTVVLSGEENDLLRRQMRDELLAFEAANADVLRNWRGVPEEAMGADEALERLFEPAELFA